MKSKKESNSSDGKEYDIDLTERESHSSSGLWWSVDLSDVVVATPK